MTVCTASQSYTGIRGRSPSRSQTRRPSAKGSFSDRWHTSHCWTASCMHAHHVPCTGSVASARSASSTGVMTCVSERRFRLYLEIQGANEQPAKRLRNTNRSADKRRFINHEAQHTFCRRRHEMCRRVNALRMQVVPTWSVVCDLEESIFLLGAPNYLRRPAAFYASNVSVGDQL